MKDKIIEILNTYRDNVSNDSSVDNYAIKEQDFNELAEELVKKITTSVVGEIKISEVDDLSYSNIVGIIQGDKEVAGNMLTKIAERKELMDNNIKNTKIKLQQLTTEMLGLKKGALLVLKHIKKETPLAVKRKDFIVVVTDEDISIERNVL